MKPHYYKETDSLYIDLSAAPGADSQEMADGLVGDSGDSEQVVGIDIQHASKCLDLTTIETEHHPFATPKIA